MPTSPAPTDPATAPALGQPVPLRGIEAGLRAFWQEQNAQRASLMNLALWSEADDALERLPPVIAAVSAEHACRALLIHAHLDPALAPESRAWITAHCHLNAHGKTACSEQIAFDFQGRMMGRIRNAVLAHLLSDLPFVLCWEGELSDFFEPNLLRRVDRLVVDSAQWADPAASWQRVLQARSDPADADGLILHDLAWSRGYSLRLQLAHEAENPRVLAALNQPLTLKIQHGPGQRASALSLAAWVATALNARLDPAQNSPNTLQFSRLDAEELRVDLQQLDQGPALQSVSLELGPDLKIELERQGNRWCARSDFGSQTSPERLSPAEPDDLANLLTSQLGRGGNNSLFERTLPLLSQLR